MLDRDVTVALAKRLLAFHEAGTTEEAADVYRVPTAHYIDADRWQLEMDRIFRRVPLPLALDMRAPRRPCVQGHGRARGADPHHPRPRRPGPRLRQRLPPSGVDRRARRLRRGPPLHLSLPRLGVRPGREPDGHVRKGDVRAGR